MLLCPPSLARAGNLPERPFLGYHESWWEVPATGPAATRLAAIPGYVNIVALSFARPDMTYAGALELGGTGLQYPYDGRVLKGAVALLRQRQPGTRIILSVGGSAYPAWHRLNADAVARLVGDVGLDGIDIDFEPAEPGCRTEGGRIRCASDRDFADIVSRLRRVLPRPAIIAVAGWSVAAFGEGAWIDAQPRSRYSGMMLNLLRGPAAADIDLVSIMAYEAGPSFKPWEAFQAYRAVWRGPLALGFHVPPQRQPNEPVHTQSFIADMTARVRQDPAGGVMLYSLSAMPPGQITPDNPDARTAAAAICRTLQLPGCGQPLP